LAEVDAEGQRREDLAADPGGEELGDRRRAECGEGRLVALQIEFQPAGGRQPLGSIEAGGGAEAVCEYVVVERELEERDRVGVGRQYSPEGNVGAGLPRAVRDVAGVPPQRDIDADAAKV